MKKGGEVIPPFRIAAVVPFLSAFTFPAVDSYRRLLFLPLILIVVCFSVVFYLQAPYFPLTLFFIMEKVSPPMRCSILHASSSAAAGETPCRIKNSRIMQCFS